MKEVFKKFASISPMKNTASREELSSVRRLGNKAFLCQKILRASGAKLVLKQFQESDESVKRFRQSSYQARVVDLRTFLKTFDCLGLLNLLT